MDNAIYTALSHQTALRRRMDATANNLANMSTVGYQGSRPLFMEYIHDPGQGRGDTVSMVIDYGTVRDLGQGKLSQTGNPLDLGLQGPGFFVIETDNGPRYTRNGQFNLNQDRELVDHQGRPVLDAGDAAIVIPEDAIDIEITEDGEIETNVGNLGQIQIVEFDNPQTLEPTGDGLFDAVDEDPLLAEATSVHQSKVERSNVNPIVEMTEMIHVLRQYQAAKEFQDSMHEKKRNTVSRISQLG